LKYIPKTVGGPRAVGISKFERPPAGHRAAGRPSRD